MSVQAFYESIQGDYEDVLHRLSSEHLIIRFVKRFPMDGTYAELMDAVEKGDGTKSFEAAHKLKGLTGTLGFTKLYNAVFSLTEQLRQKTAPADMELVQRVRLYYCDTIEKIQCLENQAEN